jgi:hypothetical protein
LILALGTGEPGHGAKGQDEEEADQKTPPAAHNESVIDLLPYMAVSISTFNIPVSHFDA